MELGLSGRTAIVTGAGQGIGLAVTRVLTAEGAKVIAGSRTVTDDLAAVPGVRAVAVDLATAEGCADLVAAAGGRTDIVVNNVGMAPVRADGFLDVEDDMWLATWTLNVMAAVRVTRAALPLMLAAGRGSIVNVGSLNARLPDPTVIDYSASKAALVNLAKSWSKEFGPRGIRVNTVDPGPVATALWLGGSGVAQAIGRSSGQSPEQVAAAAAAGMLTGRFSTPDEIAAVVAFLAGDVAANITGSDVVIDGGMAPML